MPVKVRYTAPMSAPRARPLFRADPPSLAGGVVRRDSRHVVAAKVESRVDVEIAAGPADIDTPEGRVTARAGDAIVTDSGGDTWPVPGGQFQAKYRPVAPTVAGQSGSYVSQPQHVHALRMEEPFEVLLADGRSRLSGQQGDWLVEGRDGSLYVVSAAAFARSYRIRN